MCIFNVSKYFKKGGGVTKPEILFMIIIIYFIFFTLLDFYVNVKKSLKRKTKWEEKICKYMKTDLRRCHS